MVLMVSHLENAHSLVVPLCTLRLRGGGDTGPSEALRFGLSSEGIAFL